MNRQTSSADRDINFPLPQSVEKVFRELLERHLVRWTLAVGLLVVREVGLVVGVVQLGLKEWERRIRKEGQRTKGREW